MPPRGVKSSKRARQYEHIKESASERGAGAGRAKEIAARTVNKQRSEAGEAKSSRKKAGGSRAGKRSTASAASKGGKATKKGKATRGGKKK